MEVLQQELLADGAQSQALGLLVRVTFGEARARKKRSGERSQQAVVESWSGSRRAWHYAL